MIAGRHFRNEDGIKALIVAGHRRGVCDGNGASIKKNGVFIAKPRFGLSSAVKTYVYRKGKKVLKK